MTDYDDINVQMPDIPVGGGAEKIGPREFYPEIRDILLPLLVVLGSDGIPTVEDILQMEGDGPVTQRRIVHELRLKAFPFNETAMIGQVTRATLKAAILTSVNHCRRELQIEQNNCDWQIVALKLERTVSMKLRDRSYKGQVVEGLGHPSTLAAAEGLGRDGSAEWRQSVEYFEEAFARGRVTLVFADIAGGDVVDPNVGVPNGIAAEMTRYAETREYRHLPRGLRLQRADAEKLVREFYRPRRIVEQRARPAAPPAPAPRPRATPGPKPKPKDEPPTTPTIDTPEGPPVNGGVSDEERSRVATAVMQLRAEGLAPKAISQRLGIDPSIVTAILGPPNPPETP